MWFFLRLATMAFAMVLSCKAASDDPRIPRAPLPEHVREALVFGIKTFSRTNLPEPLKVELLDEVTIDGWRKRSLNSLARFATFHWPDLSICRQVRYQPAFGLAAEVRRWRGGWYWRGPSGEAVIVDLDGDQEVYRNPALVKVEDYNFLREFASGTHESQATGPITTQLWDAGYATLTVRRSIMMAMGAAWAGDTNSAIKLIHAAMQGGLQEALDQLVGTEANRSFEEGLAVLNSGGPRSRTLGAWERILAVAGSLVTTQLVEDVPLLRQQVAEFPRLMASEIEDPDSLAIELRIRYFADRLTEVTGKQGPEAARSPGRKLIGIGYAAMPALLGALEDRRLTRAVIDRTVVNAPSRIGNQKWVLRVQDIAVNCIEAISGAPILLRTRAEPCLSLFDAVQRAKAVEEIQTWWRTHTNQSPVVARLSRLEKLPLNERVAEVEKIERMDSNSVQVVSLLKSWSTNAKRNDLVFLFTKLAQRKDLSLLPLVRELWYEGHLDRIDLINRYATPEDFGRIRERIRPWLWSKTERDRPSIVEELGRYTHIRQMETNAVWVPLFTDMLEVRDISGHSPWSQSKSGLSLADDAMRALSRLVEFDAGYHETDPETVRHAAMDRWLKWWDDGGRNAFLVKHPTLKPAFAELDRVPETVTTENLPPLAAVLAADRTQAVTYQVPAGDLVSLTRSGAVRGASVGREIQRRFTSATAETNWFKSASALPAHVSRNGGPLEKLGPPGARGIVVDAGGRIWMVVSNVIMDVESLKRQVARLAKGEGPVVLTGAALIRVDSIGRIWLTPAQAGGLLLGYDPKSDQWMDRNATARPLPPNPDSTKAERQKTEPAAFLAAALESKSGAQFFCDSWGLHVLRGKEWSYQPIFERFAQERSLRNLSYSERRFIADEEGRVYFWCTGDTNASFKRGCWIYHNGSWINDLSLPHIQDLMPRPNGEYWAVSSGRTFHVVRNGNVLDGEAARNAALPGYDFTSIRVLRTRPETDSLFLLEREFRGRFDIPRHRAIRVPTSGSIVDLGLEFGSALDLQSWTVPLTASPDGLLWLLRGNRTLEAWRRDGQRAQDPSQFHFPGPVALLRSDTRGHLILQEFGGNEQLSKFDPRHAGAGRMASSRFPSMSTENAGPFFADREGRPWCLWGKAAESFACFEDHAWKFHPRSMTNAASHGPDIETAVQGNSGEMLLSGLSSWSAFIDKDGVVEAESPEKVILSHSQRIRRAAAWPHRPTLSKRDSDRYLHMARDKAGNMWWAYYNRIGIATESQTRLFDHAELGIRQHTNSPIALLAPLGDGSRIVISTGAGETSVVSFEQNRPVIITNMTQHRLAGMSWNGSGSPLLDRSGRLWLAGIQSKALDANAHFVATNAGSILIEDSSGGLWFRTNQRGQDFLVRLDPSGAEALLTIRRLDSNVCEAPDKTFWFAEGESLVRVRLQDRGVERMETQSRSSSLPARLWYDRKGRLWHAGISPGTGAHRLDCFVTSTKPE